jgi:hypothetical protein
VNYRRLGPGREAYKLHLIRRGHRKTSIICEFPRDHVQDVNIGQHFPQPGEGVIYIIKGKAIQNVDLINPIVVFQTCEGHALLFPRDQAKDKVGLRRQFASSQEDFKNDIFSIIFQW